MRRQAARAKPFAQIKRNGGFARTACRRIAAADHGQGKLLPMARHAPRCRCGIERRNGREQGCRHTRLTGPEFRRSHQLKPFKPSAMPASLKRRARLGSLLLGLPVPRGFAVFAVGA
jgi:hypothetical protein